MKEESLYTEKLEPIEGFDLRFDALIEYNVIDGDFESEEDSQKLFDAINNGDLVWFCAKITASKNDIELGTDYLGECCYKNYKEFLNDTDGYIEDMKKKAIAEAKEVLLILCDANNQDT